MFCPKCSQEQVSDETRFCSRCGFTLSGVKALLADDGGGAQNIEIRKTDRSLRKRDLTIGAGLMFVFAFTVAVLTVSMPANHSSRILFLIVAWLAVSLLINLKPLIQYFMRGETNARDENHPPANASPGLFAKAEKRSLPAAQSIPADLLMPGAKTADFTQPPSVTEPTTNLLKK